MAYWFRELIQYQCVNIDPISKYNVDEILKFDVGSIRPYQCSFNFHFQPKYVVESMLMINIESTSN